MSFSITIRRLGLTVLLAFVLALAVDQVVDDALWISFVLLWPALFFGWPYLSRKLGFNFPKAPAPRPARRTEWGRLFITAFLSFCLSCAVAGFIHPNLLGLYFFFLWITLYYTSPFLTKRLPYFGFARTISRVAVTTPKRTLWSRVARGSLAAIGLVFTFVLIPTMILVPLSLSHRRAKKVHDSIHLGMTVSQVIHTTHDCDIFLASSDSPYDHTTNENIPAMSLGSTKDGRYHIHDHATGQDLNLSESEAIDRLHVRLHDGYPWHFHYTYINATPQHVSFSVDFGPDGRVTEVEPVYGWD